MKLSVTFIDFVQYFLLAIPIIVIDLIYAKDTLSCQPLFLIAYMPNLIV